MNYNSVRRDRQGSNRFNLSRENKLSGNMGLLYPVFTQEIIPGDRLNVKTQQLIKFSPLLAPIMHNIDFKLDYFFVPYRIIWDEWKDFITGGEQGQDMPSHPRMAVTSLQAAQFFRKGSLSDHLGFPVTETAWENHDPDDNPEISVLYHRAYQLIYHEFFRDVNVMPDTQQYKGSGLVTSASEMAHIFKLQRSNWQKDYFTSSLPWLQRGNEVTLPLGGEAEIGFKSVNELTTNTLVRKSDGTPAVPGEPIGYDAYGNVKSEDTQTNLDIDNSAVLYADLETATAVTINELRKASALQRFLELSAVAGGRYREQMLAFFGSKIPDYTLQIPQHLGGGKTPIQISEILSTYQSEGSTDRPQGDPSGHAVGVGTGLGFKQSFNEHGVVIGVGRVIPRTAYTQGLSKFQQKFDRFDHYFSHFANLGEQEVNHGELWFQGAQTQNKKVFGYQQRYAEYKYAESQIAGDFHDSLAFWELSRRFDQMPSLNTSFLECTPDDRIFAITDEKEDKMWFSLYHDVLAKRNIPYHSNPSLS